MLLAIEQGNTNSVFAIHDGEHWIAQWRSATEPSRTADEYAVWLSQLMHMHKLELGLLNACVISSVVPQLIEGMIARIKAERNEAMAVIATGGVASLFHGATTAIDHFDPDLTIRGLLEIYRRNTGDGAAGSRPRP
jgi:pantothenate kinase type III